MTIRVYKVAEVVGGKVSRPSTPWVKRGGALRERAGETILSPMDRLSRERRSQNMAAIRGKDTKPEWAVRRFIHARGLRYRLHAKGLPGSPDLIFPARRAVIFVHGCFWHGCPHCTIGARQVKSNTPYWNAKVERNKSRDARVQDTLEDQGWKVMTRWECETKMAANL